MIPLDLTNYFTPQNTAISNSKVGDFLKSKEYFYQRHISREIDPPSTIPMKLGSMVDALVSGTTIPYSIKCLKREDSDLFELQKTMDDSQLVTRPQFEEASARAHAIIKEPFYDWYVKHDTQFQVVLQGSVKYGKAKIDICGVLDTLTVTKDRVYIDDFKSVSANKLKNENSWYFTCLEYGYFRQLAVYKELFRQAHPRMKRPITCRHVIVTKIQDGLYKVYLYEIPDSLLVDSLKEFVQAVKDIHKESRPGKKGAWQDAPVKWKDIVKLNDPYGPKPWEEYEQTDKI